MSSLPLVPDQADQADQADGADAVESPAARQAARADGGARGAMRGAEAGLLVMAVLWGVNFSVVKAGLESFEPYAFNALRFLLAGLLLTATLVATGGLSLPSRRDAPRVVILGVVGHLLYQVLFIRGIALTRAGNASLLLTTAPIYIAMLSGLVRDERASARVWLGIAATVSGIALVVGGRAGGIQFGAGTVKGDLLIAFAAFLWAVYTVLARALVSRYGPLRVTTWGMWVGSPLLVLLAAPELRAVASASRGAWLAVAYSGLIAIGLGQMLFCRGLRLIGATRTAVFQNLVPVVALAIAAAWLGEVPTVAQLGGAAVILTGVSLVRNALGPARRAPAPASIRSLSVSGAPD